MPAATDADIAALAYISIVVAESSQPCLEPIQEVEIEEHRVGFASRLSMMRIMARRIQAATALA